MSTFTEIVDEVKAKLSGYTMRQERITYLANSSGINASALAITVGSGDNFAKGLIEIDDELLLIDTFDIGTSTLNVMPGFGRGYQGTTAAVHNRYAPVTLTPTFPRNMVKKAINDTIKSVFPKIYAINSTTFTFNAVNVAYVLPDDVQNVITVSHSNIGPSNIWSLCRRYRTDRMANLNKFGSTNVINIFDRILPGRTVQVTYSAIPQTLVNNTDDFVSVTGLPDSCIDIIVLGACQRLLAFIDSGRLNFTSAEADMADTKIPSYAGQAIAKYILALYQQRLSEESAKMLVQYPTATHYLN